MALPSSSLMTMSSSKLSSLPSIQGGVSSQSLSVEVARHICQEARVVLTSLRGGPIHVARGDLAQDLMDLRSNINFNFIDNNNNTNDNGTTTDNNDGNDNTNTNNSTNIMESNNHNDAAVFHNMQQQLQQQHSFEQQQQQDQLQEQQQQHQQNQTFEHPNQQQLNMSNHQHPIYEDVGPYARPFVSVIVDPRAAGPHTLVALRALFRLLERGSLIPSIPPLLSSEQPQQHQQKLKEQSQQLPHPYTVYLEPLTKGVLSCKFEQTDAGADEAVEMAIADLLALLIHMDYNSYNHTPISSTSSSNANKSPSKDGTSDTFTTGAGGGSSSIRPETLLDAFNTVFVTRNTFVHSPALCYHFEDVLTSIVTYVFAADSSLMSPDNSNTSAKKKQLILEFLVNQLLHTPLVAGNNNSTTTIGGTGASNPNNNNSSNPTSSLVGDYMVGASDDSREAFLAHDATRLLCLRLINVALKAGFNNNNTNKMETTNDDQKIEQQQHPISDHDFDLIRIIQDDLCLSLLMTGQAIWASYLHDDIFASDTSLAGGGGAEARAQLAAASGGTPGGPGASGSRSHSLSSSHNVISLEVLSEICNTISTLWNTLSLRTYLIPQFETIFTGFYQRALVLLRKRYNPTDSATFNINFIFDSQTEIIIESLIDILCLHDYSHNIAKEYGSDGGSLECLFATYDCHMKRSDVATGLFLELCRCCGGTVNEEGHNVLLLKSRNQSRKSSFQSTPSSSFYYDGKIPGAPTPPVSSNYSSYSSADAAAAREAATSASSAVVAGFTATPPRGEEIDATTPADKDNGKNSDDNSQNSEELLSSYHYNDDSFQPPLVTSTEKAMKTPQPATADTPIKSSSPPPAVTEEEDYDDDEEEEVIIKEDFTSSYYRQVPPHLKELCAQAIMGGMKCLFKDDHPSEQTLRERTKRCNSIMNQPPQQQTQQQQQPTQQQHVLRNIKSQKQLMRQAAILFNEKPSKGIEYMVSTGLVSSLTSNNVGNDNDSKSQDTVDDSNKNDENDDPVITPRAIATFLRDGIVVGLEKAAVGQYLGEAGKTASPGKSYNIWDRDWFHKEVLETYCTLFKFENQSLLDGLRMFLAAFRLPGEAQQIDRILQAFADKCSMVCEEQNNGQKKLFSNDVKKASDAAYLLSFSIIMLNTDQHNNNIRSDRKMTCNDFIRNNTDYGRDITDKGKELPKEYLTNIYESIREEEIRTEREGADGCMTIERWKDVLRSSSNDGGSAQVQKRGNYTQQLPLASAVDAEDLTELVLEQVWMPVMSAIGALWGVRSTSIVPIMVTNNNKSRRRSRSASLTSMRGNGIRGVETSAPATDQRQHPSSQSGMLNAQGARLGMDMAIDMLQGVRQLGRIDIFRRIFSCISWFTGLLSMDDTTMNTSTAVERTWSFANSVEAQCAVIVAMRTARDASDEIGVEGWKLTMSILLQLRDLKMLGSSPTINGADPSSRTRGLHIIKESDPDLLSEDARREWNMWLVKGDVDFNKPKKPKKSTSVLGVFGRALFGSSDADDYGNDDDNFNSEQQNDQQRTSAFFGKSDLILWDETAPSDDEDNNDGTTDISAIDTKEYHLQHHALSPGASFEIDLIRENLLINQRTEMPITGLEHVDDVYKRNIQASPRARVRSRLARACDFHNGLMCESRFMGIDGIQCMLQGLMDLINYTANAPMQSAVAATSEFYNTIPLSPASEAFAEVLICEIALKNKDRLGLLWNRMLKAHYLTRLRGTLEKKFASRAELREALIHSGIEKCLTGLLRICACVVQKEDTIASDILSIWKEILPTSYDTIDDDSSKTLLGVLDKHVGEGLWRIIRNVDGLSYLQPDGWEGLLALVNWCAKKGGEVTPVRRGDRQLDITTTLADDDLALQAYRTIHLMFNTEIQQNVPYSVIACIKTLITAGENRNYSQLSIAGLDLLNNLLEQRLSQANPIVQEDDAANNTENKTAVPLGSDFWEGCWTRVVETISTVVESGKNTNVRQHALSILTDTFLDKRGSYVPVHHLCGVLSDVCISRTGRAILSLRMGVDGQRQTRDEVMIEFELCIGLIFKPFRHHLKRVVDVADGNGSSLLLSLWRAILVVMDELLGDESCQKRQQQQQQKPDDEASRIPDELSKTMDELANEHFRNAISVLVTAGLLKDDDSGSDGKSISAVTWEYVSRMESCKMFVNEWKLAAANSSQSGLAPVEAS